MCYWALRKRLCGVSPHSPQGALPLDPSCGCSWLVLHTLCRRSRNILIQEGRKTANLQCINTLLPILNSCTNEILHSAFFILNFSLASTGWRCSTAGRMLCIRGKQKKAGRKFAFSPALFHVFIVPVGLVSFVSFGAVRWATDSIVLFVFYRLLFFRAKNVCSSVLPLRLPGAGRNSLPWGTGDEQSPASFLGNRRKLFVCTHNHFACRVQGGTPCRRGTGDE